jgi:hypothetical protein
MDPNTTNLNEALAKGKIVTHPQLSYCLETPAAEASGLLGAGAKGFCETGRSRALVIPSLAVLALALMAPRCQGADGHQLSQRIYRRHWIYNTGKFASWRVDPFDSKSMRMDC